MPRNIRNFWIETFVDGRNIDTATGPRAKDGGFETHVSIRNNGCINKAVSINGWVNTNGKELSLHIIPNMGLEAAVQADGSIILRTKR